MSSALGATRWRWAPAAVGLLLAAGLVLSGCSAFSTILATQRALESAGYQSVHVTSTFSSNSSDVDVTVSVQTVPTDATAQNVALVVWSNFHERFDFLTVTIHGEGPELKLTYSFDELETDLGTRNPAWNRTSVRSAYTDVGAEVVGGLVAIGAIVLVIVLVTRRRRRRAAPVTWPGPGPVYGGPGSGYPLWQPPPYLPQQPGPPSPGPPQQGPPQQAPPQQPGPPQPGPPQPGPPQQPRPPQQPGPPPPGPAAPPPGWGPPPDGDQHS